MNPGRIDVSAIAGRESTFTGFNFRNAGTELLTFTVESSSAWMVAEPASGSAEPGEWVRVNLYAECGGEAVAGQIVLRSNAPANGSATLPFSIDCLIPQEGIGRVTLNQGSQSFDSTVSNTPSFPLAEGRDTQVRVWVLGDGAVPEGRVIVTGPDRVETALPLVTPWWLAPILTDHSHHVVVPGDVIRPGATLQVEIDQPEGEVLRFPADAPLSLLVTALEPFELTFVPIVYEGEVPSIDVDLFFVNARIRLPIGFYDVEVRAPYTFSGTHDLERMLAEIAELRLLDGSRRLYHGVVNDSRSSTSDLAGVAYLGAPVSVSLGGSVPLTTIAHELGHNLGLQHAPACDAPAPDPRFPYRDGGIGVDGFDINGLNVIDVDDGRKDFMSYCRDTSIWVSDYHFAKALAFRSRTTASSAAASGAEAYAMPAGLMISGRMENGQVTDLWLLPTDRGPDRSEAGRSGSLRFMAWDANGRELISYPFRAHAVEHSADAAGFHFVVPRPTAGIHHYEIREDRHTGAVTLFSGRVLAAGHQLAAPSASWEADRVRVAWVPRSGAVLIVRDSLERIVTIDRTGSLELSGLDSLTLEVVAAGHSAGRVRHTRPAKQVAPG